jgi:hypothetical protein
MADGQGVDVLEDGLRAEEKSAALDEMRQVWRAEAEKAAQYFSAIPGFGHLPSEVPVRQPVDPEPGSPDLAGPDPSGTETPAEPSQDEIASVVGTTGGTTTAQKDKTSRVGLLVRLRQRLGRRPRKQQASSDEDAVAERPQPQSTSSDGPPVAEKSQAQSKRFHSSF